MSVVLKRTFIGIGLLAVLAGWLFLDYWVDGSNALGKLSHGLPFTILVLIIANLTVFEVVRMIRKRGIDVHLPLLMLSVTIMIIGGFFVGQKSMDTEFSGFSMNSLADLDFQTINPETKQEILKIAVIQPTPLCLMILLGLPFFYSFFIIVKTLFGSGDYNSRMMTIVMSIFTFALVGIPYTLSIFVRAIPFFGLKLIILIILASRIGDSGAFFVGKALGKIKAIPQISPNKTIEGCIGGLLTSVLIGVLLAFVFDLGVIFNMNNLNAGALMGFVIGFTAQIADLLSSLIKRWAEVKDSSNLLPHFGGILDLTDNFILTLPVLYIILLIIWL